MLLLFRPWRLRVLDPRPDSLIAREDPRAGVPPENGLVVPRRPAGRRLLVPVHRLAEPLVGQLPRPHRAAPDVGLGAPLGDDTGVVVTPILVVQPGQQRVGPAHAL